jgi:hypothetical protein
MCPLFVVELVMILGIGLGLRELDISLFFRIVANPETLNGENQSDESWN